MDSLEIAFARHVGICRGAEGQLMLPFSAHLHNHLAAVHASAQFTLAETASGEFLLTSFPHWAGRVLPLLREAEVRYRRPAKSDLTAHATADATEMQDLERRLMENGRALLTVQVALRDAAGDTTLVGRYKWYIQRAADDSAAS